jgi:PAS domain S-box-containing protein
MTKKKINSDEAGGIPRRTEAALRESEEKYRRLFERACFGIFRSTPDGKAISVNPAFAAMFGYDSAEDALKHIKNVSRDVFADPNRRTEIIRLIEENPGLKTFENLYLRKDGSSFTGVLNVMPVRDSQGRIEYLEGFIEEITERKQSEEALRNSLSLTEATLESIHNGILVVDHKGTVIKTNANFAEMWHIPDDILNSGDDNILLDHVLEQLAYPDEFINKVTELYGKPEAESLDLIIFKDGRIFERISKPMYLGGEPKGRVWSFLDITERRKAQEALLESERILRASQMVARLGSFVWDISSGIWKSSEILDDIFGIDEKYVRSFEGWAALIHPDWKEIMKDYVVKEVLEKHKKFDKEYLIIRPHDGQEHWVHGLAELELDDDDQPLKLIGTISDITARKDSEKTISMLAHAIRSVSECVSITDMTDEIIFVNSAFLKTYQFEEHELLGKSISMVRSPNNSRDFVKEILPATLHGGWQGEVLNLRKDGSEFPVFVSTSVIYNENNKPLALVGVTTDITERKRAEKELIESETRNKALLAAIPDLMFMFNREGVFVDFHTPDPKSLITGPEYFLGRSVAEVLPHELAELTMSHLHEVFEKGKTSVYEYSIIEGNEELIYESRIVACGKDLALSIVRDISDRKKMEYKMIQSERLTALGEMSAGMAHEINQPLNTLSILFDNILFEAKQSHAVSEKYLVSKANKIFDNILRIKNLIDHVREFSRSQEGYVFTQFNINESIINALSMVSEQFKISGIALITDLDENLPLIKGNTYKFEQVILNLILNSKDALLEKKSDLNELYPMFIKITTKCDGKKINIHVEDNGTGIKDEHRDKIFEPFYTTKETGKGTGLGLSISYGLIREINGEIDIKSKVQKGTIFSITIPLKNINN